MLVKICGITNLGDALFALEVGADWIGLNLVAGPRQIERSAAERILTGLDDPSRAVVLLHTQEGGLAESLLKTLQGLGVRKVQLYGRLTAATVSQVACAGLDTILVHHVTDLGSLAPLRAMLESFGGQPPSHLLVDAKTPTQLGGTGTRADWATLSRARAIGVTSTWPPLILAGGLTPTNVAEAIRTVAPAGVDVSSGVETQPGQKDRAKIEAFVNAARG